ncbi:MAG: MBOAT family protein [Lachnospiraceae bacterium]|nr:MBOAT family protein [Lachnospiraceae bacterium]
MLFNSISFGIFLVIVFLLYYTVPHKYRWLFLLLTSYAFYMNLHLWYGLLLFGATFLTYTLAIFLEKAQSAGQKKGYLLLGTLPLILVLVFFKTGRSILLPIGISFYFFQSMGYLIDVYRGKIKAERHFGYYALFVSFFPQLFAGPIGRADALLPQYKKERPFVYDNVTYGLKLMAWGYFKKLVIADVFAQTVNQLYDHVHSYVGFAFIVVTVMYAIEIYCDFSGYSDIAIGCAKLFGIDFMTNFKSPYFSFSIKEFWSRWHISLSTWFRDYVYIPLGGNRVPKWRHCLNLLITFLVSGFWHGSALTYLLWGALHGLLQIAETLLYPKGKERKRHFLYLPVTFILLCFTWIFFRANSIQDALWVISRLFWDASRPLNYLKTAVICLNLSYAQMFGMGLSVLALAVYDYFSLKYDVIMEISKQKFFIRWPVYVLLLVTIALFSSKGVATEFIYFQF